MRRGPSSPENGDKEKHTLTLTRPAPEAGGGNSEALQVEALVPQKTSSLAWDTETEEKQTLLRMKTLAMEIDPYWMR